MTYREFTTYESDGTELGTVQVVEGADDTCTVGYTTLGSGEWQHWGSGEGGYKATCARFSECSTFNK